MKPTAWILPVLGLLTLPAFADDPNQRHNLDELAARDGSKPYDRMVEANRYPSERTVFSDTLTGTEMWRLTHELGDDKHTDYDIPAWNRDGSMLLLWHGSGIGVRYWVMPSDSSWMGPLIEGTGDEQPIEPPEGTWEGFDGETAWSWFEPDWLYGVDRGVVYRIDWKTGERTAIVDIGVLAGLSDPGKLKLPPPHPMDDWLVLETQELGRFFWVDPWSGEWGEIPTEGQWATADGIHKTRWVRNPEHDVMLAQNWVLVNGQRVAESIQWHSDLLGDLENCNPAGATERPNHPEQTVEGNLIVGSVGGKLWTLSCSGEALDTIIYNPTGSAHSSSTLDGRWDVTDNGFDSNSVNIRGFEVGDALIAVSFDGRAQSVLGYHYASYGDDPNTQPEPFSSPDGTKLVFDSDMLERGELGGASTGNSDLWMAVLRRPTPPANVDAAVVGGSFMRVTWEAPRHAPWEIYWNPGNEAREIAGYHVYRGTASGGPYTQLTSAPVVDTEFVDDTVSAGTDYFYVVQSVEHAGLASLYSNEDRANTAGGTWETARLYYEAESGQVLRPMVEQIDPAGASGGWYVGTFAAEPDVSFPTEDPPAVAAMTIDVPRTAAYTLWARVRAYDGATGSFSVEVDGASQGSLSVTADAWTWVKLPSTVSLSSGLREISLLTFEESMALDRIALFTDSATPPAAGNNDVAAPAPPTNTRLVRIDGTTKLLAWDASPSADVQYYNVYCGRDGSYALDNHSILLSPGATRIFDWGIPAGWNTVYKVTSVDRFGNESAPVLHDPAIHGEGVAPVGVADAYSVDEDAVLDVTGSGVLANDSDGDGDELTAVLVNNVHNGVLDFSADGRFTYTPNPDYHGSDSFTYKAHDGVADSALTTVSLTVNSVNDPPVALGDAYAVTEDVKLNQNIGGGLLSNDSDLEGSPLTAVVFDAPANGSVTPDANGSFVYDPNDNFFGVDTFTYRAFDGEDYSAVTTVTLTVSNVDDAPLAVKDSYSTNEDTLLSVAAPGVLANDSEVDGQVMSAVLDTPPASGSLTLNGNGSFTFLPALDTSGTVEFWYHATDGVLSSASVKVTLTVNAVNDAPLAVNDAFTGNEDSNIGSGLNLLTNDTDVDNGSLDTILVSPPSHGTLTIFNTDTGGFTYKPDTDYHGSDSFTYMATDGSLNSNVATVSLTLQPVNDAPTAVVDSYEVNEDTTLNVAAPGVMANDSDVDGDDLTASLVTNPLKGTLSFSANGSFTYTPNDNYVGSDSFKYKVTDGSLNSADVKVTLTVLDGTDAPLANPDAFSIAEDKTLTIGANKSVLLNDSDPDGDPLTALLNADPGNGTLALNADGSFTYTPAANFTGTDTFKYKASDGTHQSAAATVTITVTPVNDKPTAVTDAYSVIEDTTLTVSAPGVLANDVDIDGDSLTAVLSLAPTKGTLTLNANGSFTYRPNTDYVGNDSFKYKAKDAVLQSAAVTVNLTITNANDAPTAVADSFSVAEDKSLVRSAQNGVLSNDTDPDGDPLTALLVSNPTKGTLTFGADGSFTYVPQLNYNGPDSFTYKVTDGTLTSPAATVSLTVTPVNDKPKGVADSYSTPKNTALSVAAPGVLANDSDVEGSSLIAVLFSPPSKGTVVLNANGSFVYTPNANVTGTDSFKYQASDGVGLSVTTKVTITITN